MENTMQEVHDEARTDRREEAGRDPEPAESTLKPKFRPIHLPRIAEPSYDQDAEF
jgi:hypothetical protein